MKPYQLLRGLTSAALLVWTAIIAGILAWDRHVAFEHAEELSKKEARIHFN